MVLGRHGQGCHHCDAVARDGLPENTSENGTLNILSIPDTVSRLDWLAMKVFCVAIINVLLEEFYANAILLGPSRLIEMVSSILRPITASIAKRSVAQSLL
jgi:hypothetical protein